MDRDQLRRKSLETSLGFRIARFSRLGGAAAANYEVVRASDGYRFVAKFSHPDHQLFACLLEHLESLSNTKAIKRVFADSCPTVLAGENVVCLEWCGGVSLTSDQLTDAQFSVFLKDYLEFASAMQRVKVHAPAKPLLQWRDDAISKCRGYFGAILKHRLMAIPEAELVMSSTSPRLIHGDFHHGNFHFDGGRLCGIFDLEEIREGLIADDMVRYFTCSAGHLPWYAFCRRRRLLQLFKMAVRRLPYSRQDWLAAIDGRFVHRVFMKTRRARLIGSTAALKLLYCDRFYSKLRQILTSSFHDEQ